MPDDAAAGSSSSSDAAGLDLDDPVLKRLSEEQQSILAEIEELKALRAANDKF